jgi:hypothetical protein
MESAHAVSELMSLAFRIANLALRTVFNVHLLSAINASKVFIQKDSYVNLAKLIVLNALLVLHVLNARQIKL